MQWCAKALTAPEWTSRARDQLSCAPRRRLQHGAAPTRRCPSKPQAHHYRGQRHGLFGHKHRAAHVFRRRIAHGGGACSLGSLKARRHSVTLSSSYNCRDLDQRALNRQARMSTWYCHKARSKCSDNPQLKVAKRRLPPNF